jgi:hypothetical protein
MSIFIDIYEYARAQKNEPLADATQPEVRFA